MVIEDNWLVDVLPEDLVCGVAKVPEGICGIKPYSFYKVKTKLLYVIIPKSVKYIGDEAFVQCHGLEKVILSEGLQHIGRYAFSDCHRIKKIDIPKSCDFICEGAFYGCYNIKRVVISRRTVVKHNAFSRYTKTIWI